MRAESEGEARQVGRWVKDWPGVRHEILTWEGEKPGSRIMEEARTARYGLMENYCVRHGIGALFLAHHMDDQAETFLIRLAGGSGLDGLSCMSETQKRGQITLFRPLLQISKDDLVLYCRDHRIPCIEDPSNENSAYLRPRMRKSRGVLEQEGLTSARLCVTAGRLQRARAALEEIAAQTAKDVLIAHENSIIKLDLVALRGCPEEIQVRVVAGFMRELSGDAGYGPRTEKIEALAGDLFADGAFRKRTLGGCIVSRRDRAGEIVIEREK